jgi:hypothetical protein
MRCVYLKNGYIGLIGTEINSIDVLSRPPIPHLIGIRSVVTEKNMGYHHMPYIC